MGPRRVTSGDGENARVIFICAACAGEYGSEKLLNLGESTMKKMLSVVAVALAFGASAAYADEAAFTALDIDKDGMISVEEAKVDEALAAKFAELDANKDEKLDMTEFAAFVK